MNIDEIRELLKSGDVAGAENAAKAALETEPDNVRLMIVFGTCRQLQGDEEAFLGTYELVRAALDEKKVELDATAAEEWKRFEALHKRIAQPELLQKGDPPRKSNLMEYVLIAVLIASVGAVAIWYFGRSIPQALVGTVDDATTANVHWRVQAQTTANVEYGHLQRDVYKAAEAAKQKIVTENENRIK